MRKLNIGFRRRAYWQGMFPSPCVSHHFSFQRCPLAESHLIIFSSCLRSCWYPEQQTASNVFTIIFSPSCKTLWKWSAQRCHTLLVFSLHRHPYNASLKCYFALDFGILYRFGSQLKSIRTTAWRSLCSSLSVCWIWAACAAFGLLKFSKSFLMTSLISMEGS